ncbi:HAD family hydrolase [Paenibacillus hamazuiensis]|uniref:HAD family hydrolase n=1 Tax=Paenibacillus hamazuiensis TaxID=2936508 RepID=UPI00200E737F|nr:HAD family hydrolase [Paenibacillus hamazuiensis]
MKLKEISIGKHKVKAQAIGFDKDGTLFDALTYWRNIDRIRKELFLQIVGSKHENAWEKIMGFVHPDRIHYSGVLAVATTEEEIILVAGLMFQLHAWPWYQCKKLASDLFIQADKKLEYDRAFSPAAGVPDLLLRLKSKEWTVGILTSDSSLRTNACMKLIGMQEMLDFIVTPENVERGKPSPDLVFYACEKIGIDPSQLIVVGDSIVDMRMAKEAGSIAVGLVTHAGSEEILGKEADFLIHSLTEIEP